MKGLLSEAEERDVGPDEDPEEVCFKGLTSPVLVKPTRLLYCCLYLCLYRCGLDSDFLTSPFLENPDLQKGRLHYEKSQGQGGYPGS